MGYFSNGTEGDIYKEHWCRRCANCGDERGDFGCAVWDAHFLYNYDQHTDEGIRKVLNVLIPRAKDGGNERCLMFRERGKGGGGQPEPVPVPLTIVRAA